jgi:hypothetical protein
LSERSKIILRIGAGLVLVTSMTSGWYYGFVTKEARPLHLVSLGLTAVATLGLFLLSYQLPRRR